MTTSPVFHSIHTSYVESDFQLKIEISTMIRFKKNPLLIRTRRCISLQGELWDIQRDVRYFPYVS